MLIKALIVVGLLLVVFLIVVYLRPSDFRYTRTASIFAPPAVIFAQVNDLHKWEAWSPWAKMDPNAKTVYNGTESGLGAGFGWASGKTGEGHMTITESRPDSLVRLRLDFKKPFAATNTAEFTFTPEGDHTVVSWSMFGKTNFMGKAIGLFIDCEKMCGGQFEQGLGDMKKIAEGERQNAHAVAQN